MDLRDVLATTCPLDHCLAYTPNPCRPGAVHGARLQRALMVLTHRDAMLDDLNRRTVHRGLRRRIEDILAADPFALLEAATNWQVLQEPPSRLKTAPYPIVGSGREFR